MAEIVRRRSCGGGFPFGRHASINASSCVHSASPSIAPPHSGGAKRPHTEPVQGRTGRRSLKHLAGSERIGSEPLAESSASSFLQLQFFVTPPVPFKRSAVK